MELELFLFASVQAVLKESQVEKTFTDEFKLFKTNRESAQVIFSSENKEKSYFNWVKSVHGSEDPYVRQHLLNFKRWIVEKREEKWNIEWKLV